VPNNRRTFAVLVALVIIVGILIRAATALWLGDRAEPISGAYDQVSYDTLAQQLLAGKGFSFPVDWYPFTKANEPTAHWSFLYTLYLAGVYAAFGHHPLAARLLQVLLSGLNFWLAYRIGKRLFGEMAGVAAAALTAVYAYLIFFNAVLMTQTFYILAVLTAIDVAFLTIQNPSRRHWLLLGFAIGIGVLLRQTLLLFAPFLFAWIAWAIRGHSALGVSGLKAHANRPSAAVRRGKLTAFSGILLSSAVIASLILPWTIRNYLTYHDFLLLNSNGGYWFYASNHPLQGTDFNQSLAPPIPQNLHDLSEPTIDRALFSQGLGFIMADPERFFLLSVNRIKDYYWLFPSEQSSTIANLSRTLSFPIYLPLMLYGLWLSRRQWRACLPLYLYVAFDALLCLSTWSAPRYRLPSDAILMPFAGLAAVSLASQFGIIPLWASKDESPQTRLDSV
jgi:Dolichyl-phosphate-mannose-protein mannosyltransferase